MRLKAEYTGVTTKVEHQMNAQVVTRQTNDKQQTNTEVESINTCVD